MRPPNANQARPARPDARTRRCTDLIAGSAATRSCAAPRSRSSDDCGKGTASVPRTISAKGGEAPSTDSSVTMNSGRFFT